MVKPYLEHYGINHREKFVAFAEGRLEHVNRLLSPVLLPDLTEDAIRGYIKTRLKEKASGCTVNMEVGELSRAIGKPWSVLWPKVRKLEERKEVGKALSTEEETKLLNASPNRHRPIAPASRHSMESEWVNSRRNLSTRSLTDKAGLPELWTS